MLKYTAIPFLLLLLYKLPLSFKRFQIFFLQILHATYGVAFEGNQWIEMETVLNFPPAIGLQLSSLSISTLLGSTLYTVVQIACSFFLQVDHSDDSHWISNCRIEIS